MVNRTDITAEILEALRELNKQLSTEQQLPVSPDTPLFGDQGLLDSLGMVNLILLVEERIFNRFDIEITLSNDQVMSQPDSPFRNVQSLTQYVTSLIDASSELARRDEAHDE